MTLVKHKSGDFDLVAFNVIWGVINGAFVCQTKQCAYCFCQCYYWLLSRAWRPMGPLLNELFNKISQNVLYQTWWRKNWKLVWTDILQKNSYLQSSGTVKRLFGCGHVSLSYSCKIAKNYSKYFLSADTQLRKIRLSWYFTETHLWTVVRCSWKMVLLQSVFFELFE